MSSPTSNLPGLPFLGLLLLAAGLTLMLTGTQAMAQYPNEDPYSNKNEPDWMFGAGCIAIIVVVVIVNLVILIWLYKDAQLRGKGDEAIFWIIAALVGGPIVCLIWLLVRPDQVPPGYQPGYPPGHPPYPPHPPEYPPPGQGGMGPGYYPPPPEYGPHDPEQERYDRRQGPDRSRDNRYGGSSGVGHDARYDAGYGAEEGAGQGSEYLDNDRGGGDHPDPRYRPPRYPPPE